MGHEKVGRNEPCPCGSGKKYKKCCWSKDEETKAQAVGVQSEPWPGSLLNAVYMAPNERTVHGLSELMGRTFEVLEDMSGKKLRRALGVFGKMLDTDGPFARIRFEQALFDRVVADGTKALEDGSHHDFHDQLFFRCIPRLVNRGFLQETTDRLTRFLRNAEASDEERLSASVILAILTAGDSSAHVEPADNPALQVIFERQLQDGLRPFDGVRERLRSIFEKAKAKNARIGDFERELSDMGPELQAMGAKAPWLFHGMRKESDEIVDEAFKILESRRPPPVYTLDEILLLGDAFMAALPRLQAAQKAGDEATSAKVVEELITIVDPLIEEFLPGMKARIIQGLDDDELSRRRRKELATVLLGFNADPLRLGFHAFKHAGFRPWLRFEDEEQFVEPLVGLLVNHEDNREALARYAAYLDEKNESQAAERVRRLLASRQSVKVEATAVVTVAAST